MWPIELSDNRSAIQNSTYIFMIRWRQMDSLYKLWTAFQVKPRRAIAVFNIWSDFHIRSRPKMFCHRFVAILILMIMTEKAKSDGGSNGGSNNVDDNRCGHLSEPNSTWITNAAQTFLFWAVQSKSQDIPVCQASVLYSIICVCAETGSTVIWCIIYLLSLSLLRFVVI